MSEFSSKKEKICCNGNSLFNINYERSEYANKMIAAGAPIDSGYAWVIAFAAFGMCAVIGSLHRCHGYMTQIIMDYFDCSTVRASAPFTTAVLATYLFAPVTGRLAEHYSTRQTTAIAGILLVGANFVLIFWNPWIAIFLLYGIISGIGYAFAYSPTVSLVGHYFEGKRAIANGITMAGSTLGPTVLLPLFLKCYEFYGHPGMFTLLSCCTAQLFIIAALQRPLSYFTGKQTVQFSLENTTENRPARHSLPDNNIHSTFDIFYEPQQTPTMTKEEAPAVVSCWEKLRILFGNSVLREPVNMMLLWGLNLGNITGPMFFLSLPLHMHDLGMPASDLSSIIFYASLADLFGRLSIGFVADMKCVPSVYLCVMVNCVLSLAWLGMATRATTYVGFLVCGLFLVYANGCIVALNGAIFANELGVERLNDAMGIYFCLHGISTFLILTLVGFIRDIWGSWIINFYLSCFISALGAILIIAFIWFRSNKKKEIESIEP